MVERKLYLRRGRWSHVTLILEIREKNNVAKIKARSNEVTDLLLNVELKVHELRPRLRDLFGRLLCMSLIENTGLPNIRTYPITSVLMSIYQKPRNHSLLSIWKF